MGFEMIPCRSGGRTMGDIRVAVRNNGAGHRIFISITETLLLQLGFALPGSEERQSGLRIEISAGTEEDAGWLRLQAGPGGFLLRKANRRGDYFLAMQAPAGAPNTAPPTAVEYRIDEGAQTVFLKLPFGAEVKHG